MRGPWPRGQSPRPACSLLPAPPGPDSTKVPVCPHIVRLSAVQSHLASGKQLYSSSRQSHLSPLQCQESRWGGGALPGPQSRSQGVLVSGRNFMRWRCHQEDVALDLQLHSLGGQFSQVPWVPHQRSPRDQKPTSASAQHLQDCPGRLLTQSQPGKAVLPPQRRPEIPTLLVWAWCPSIRVT